MTLDQLRYFIAAAKYEHVNRAAKSIPISASVISNAIKELEEELNCILFIREKQTIRISSHGIRLLELASSVLDQTDRIKEKLGNEHAPLAGHYRIGASDFLATKLLAPTWTKLQNKHPQVTADISSQPTWTLVESILLGKLDFAIGFNPAQNPQLEFIEIYSGRSQVVVRKNHPIFKISNSKPYKHLRDYPATMHTASEKVTMERPHPVLKAIGIDGEITFGFDNDYVAAENLKHSNNWCFMIDLAIAEFAKDLRVISVPNEDTARYSIKIIKRKSRPTDAVMRAAFELLQQAAPLMKNLPS